MKTCTIFIFVSFLVLFVPKSCEASKILGYFPGPSKSHVIIHCAVAETLAEAGHDVTIISTFPNALKQYKYKYIFLDGPKVNEKFTNRIVTKPTPIYQVFPEFLKHLANFENETLSHPIMREFMKQHKEGSFDLLILGCYMNDMSLGLAAHFNCPVAINFVIRPVGAINNFIRNPHEIAYVPLLFSNNVQPMNFGQRVKNFLAYLYEAYATQAYRDYYSQINYDYHFPTERYPLLKDLRKNISIIFVNHHTESQGPIRPNVPALIEIGGIQIQEKTEPLSKDIFEAVRKAKNGFIYFSLGSVVKANYIHKNKMKIIFEVLSKLPFTVLWKWDEEDVLGYSSNIIFKSWLPQGDILAQPNCKLFITHGGQGSIVEAQYHGVPIVAIPLFADQPANAATIVNMGFGLSINYDTFTKETFSKTVLEVLANSKYSQAIKQFSRLYRDRPMTAKQRLVYWVEYIIRHQGAKHLQSPAVHLNILQLLSLDVIAFLLLILAFFYFVIVFSIKKFCNWNKSRVKQVTQIKKNQ